MENVSYTKDGCLRLARAVLNWTLRDIHNSACPEGVANAFFADKDNASLFCALAEIDVDIFRSKCYELVLKRESELCDRYELMEQKHNKKIMEVEKWITPIQ